jgi:hypothetical protein
MRKLVIATFMVTVLLVSSEVRGAAEVPTEALIPECEHSSPSKFCIGLILGVSATLLANKDIEAAWRICINSFVSNGQLIRVFINYAKANPRYWQARAQDVMIAAFTTTWPCPKLK